MLWVKKIYASMKRALPLYLAYLSGALCWWGGSWIFVIGGAVLYLAAIFLWEDRLDKER